MRQNNDNIDDICDKEILEEGRRESTHVREKECLTFYTHRETPCSYIFPISLSALIARQHKMLFPTIAFNGSVRMPATFAWESLPLLGEY